MNARHLLRRMAVAMLAAVLLVAHAQRPRRFRVANALPDPNVGAQERTFLAGGTLATRHLLVKYHGSDTTKVIANTLAVQPLGTICDENPATGYPVTVNLWTNGKPRLVVNDGSTVTPGVTIYASGSGKCGTTSSGAVKIGRALGSATADGELFEIEPVPVL